MAKAIILATMIMRTILSGTGFMMITMMNIMTMIMTFMRAIVTRMMMTMDLKETTEIKIVATPMEERIIPTMADQVRWDITEIIIQIIMAVKTKVILALQIITNVKIKVFMAIRATEIIPGVATMEIAVSQGMAERTMEV